MNKLTREQMDSDEEFWFYHWLLDAKRYNLISGINYHPKTYTLSEKISVKAKKKLKTKTKIMDKFMLHPHLYTPDFSFRLSAGILRPLFFSSQFLDTNLVIVDVKGGFSRFGDPKQFSINQKWTWQNYGDYVEKIVPDKLFKKTWVPDICRFSPKKRQPVKKYIGCRTIELFMVSY